MAINIEELTSTIIEKIGGIENVTLAEMCVTRLRFKLKDKNKADTEGLKKVDGVLSVVYGAGLYQVVLGANVFPVFEKIKRNYNIETSEVVEDPELLGQPEKKNFNYYLQAVIQFLSASVTPFVTVLYGAGMLKVVLSLASYFWPEVAQNSTYTLFNYLATTPFYFMPILIAYGTAKTLKSNPVFAIAMAAALLYPDFVGLVGGDTTVTMLGIPVILVKYANTFLPALLSTILLAYLERFFYKVVPAVLRTVFAPLCILAVAYPIVVLIVAPLGTIIGGYIVNMFVGLYKVTGGISVGLLAAVWPFIVMGGFNMLFVAPMLELLSNLKYDNFFRPTWVLHNIAEGGACIGVAIRAKDKQLKSDAISAAIGAIVSGVSEPAIYGINLRLRKPLLAVVIGGFVGGCTAGLLGAKAYSLGYSSILAIPIFLDTMLAITIAIGVTLVVSIAATLIMGFDEDAIAEK